MRSRILFGLLSTLALAGCPRDVQPPPPGEATPCEATPDCNGGRTCGQLSVCVGGFCESERSLAIPCPGEGVPVSR